MDLKTYMRLYTLIHDICTTGKATGHDTRDERQRRRPANMFIWSSRLYMWLNDYLKARLDAMHAEMAAQSDDSLLSFYVERWNRYNAAAKYNQNLFRFLDRHYVKREQDEGHTDVHEVYTLHLIRWKEDVLESGENPTVHILRHQINRTRAGEDAEPAIVDELVKSFVTLGVDEAS